MTQKHIIISGGCGFIGSNLAIALVQEGYRVTCLDNLSRRGSEIILDRLCDAGIYFVHGDARCMEDFAKLPTEAYAFIECSAEPSVLAGTEGADARFLIQNNLYTAVNCFEFSRMHAIPLLFLSTSRVYPHDAINALDFEEGETRFNLKTDAPGVSTEGIDESFPLDGERSLYGATKLAAELLLKEYGSLYDLPCIINRFGVIAGPWQLGKIDQGVLAYWVQMHEYERPLNYIGYGGKGKQVRDVLHIDDAIALIKLQLKDIHQYRGEIFNAGGGQHSSASLYELTALCEKITGKKIPIGRETETRPADLIWYVTNSEKAKTNFTWAPKKTPFDILQDYHNWLKEHPTLLEKLFTR